jgi:mannitol/fructose-specific phosphotransferase system IIA component (Ntr-type)
MTLSEFFSPEAIQLELASTAADQVLPELVTLLRLDAAAGDTVVRILRRREELGSTGVGRGIAIPHARSLVVSRLRLAYGRSVAGVGWGALDGRPVHHFFLIVAPPVEVSNQYLPVLAKIAAFAKEADVPDRLMALCRPEEFLALLAEKGC